VRVTVLLNPGAGSADALADDDALGVLRERYRDVRIVEGRVPGDLVKLAARAVRDGADVVVAAGGDGTLNEVLNGVARVRGGLSRVALGLLPLGTGNDFARTVGIPTEPAEALACLARGRVRRLDVVRLNDRLFINASGGGFTAETSSRVSGRLKAWTGRLAYLVGGVHALLEHQPVLTEVRLDGRRLTIPLQLFAVCNGCTLGGGHTLAPEALPDDGWLDVCLVHGESTLDMVTLLPRMSSGDHIDDAQVVYARARRVSLHFAAPTKVNADGEVLVTTQCHYEVLPGAVQFVC
jgi:diacylglycerol kinase (ATP)